MSDINDELRGAAEDARREIRGLENIVGNTGGMLHDIHEPGRDGEDDPGASPFWHAVAGDGYMKVMYHPTQRDYIALAAAVHAELPQPPVQIITTPAIRARYAATLERLARERNEAAYEWNRLHWWQWRKRKRLWRKLFGIGGWRIAPTGLWEELPERVTRCGRFIKHYQEGGC